MLISFCIYNNHTQKTKTKKKRWQYYQERRQFPNTGVSNICGKTLCLRFLPVLYPIRTLIRQNVSLMHLHFQSVSGKPKHGTGQHLPWELAIKYNNLPKHTWWRWVSVQDGVPDVCLYTPTDVKIQQKNGWDILASCPVLTIDGACESLRLLFLWSASLICKCQLRIGRRMRFVSRPDWRWQLFPSRRNAPRHLLNISEALIAY